MLKLSRKSIRVALASLMLLLVLALVFFGVQPITSSLASVQSPDLATAGQKAAVLGANMLLLSDNAYSLYMPLVGN